MECQAAYSAAADGGEMTAGVTWRGTSRGIFTVRARELVGALRGSVLW